MSINKLDIKVNNCIMQKENINKIVDKVNEIIDEIPVVEANPTGEATEDLEKIQVGETIYGVSGGGGGDDPFYTLEITMGNTLSLADAVKVTNALAQSKPIYLISSTNYDEGKEEWENTPIEGFCSRDSQMLVLQYYDQIYLVNNVGVSVYKITTTSL